MGLAGCVSRLPTRSSHHGASTKLVVPAGGPQPPEVLRHLPGARGRFSEGNPKGLSLAGGQFAGSCASPGTGEVKMLDGAQSRDDGKFSGCFGYLKIFLLFAGLPASASLHNGFDPFPSARGRDHRHLAIAPFLKLLGASSRTDRPSVAPDSVAWSCASACPDFPLSFALGM